MSRRSSLLDSVGVLTLIGILAGALGGLGVGIISSRSSSSAATTATAPH